MVKLLHGWSQELNVAFNLISFKIFLTKNQKPTTPLKFHFINEKEPKKLW